jgi:hypothetical protein
LHRRITAEISTICVLGSSEADDTLTIDLSAGLTHPLEIIYEGGEGGYDSLVLLASPDLEGHYTAVGRDGGVIRLVGREAAVAIRFSGLEPVTITPSFPEKTLPSYTFVTSGVGVDSIAVDSPAAGQNRITGTTGGEAFEVVTFFGVASVTIDTSANDTPGADGDSVTISESGLIASGLQDFSILTGDGQDSVTVNVSDAILPVSGGRLNINTGPVETDRLIIRGTAGDDTFDVSAWGVCSGGATIEPMQTGAGLIVIRGEGGQDTINVLPTGAFEILVNGGDGTDELFVDPQGRDATIGVDTVEVSGLRPVHFLAATENVSLVPGLDEVIVDRCIDYGRSDTADDDYYRYGAEAVGPGITALEVTTPWGETVSSADYLPADWSGQEIRQQAGQLEFEAGTDNDGRWIFLGWEMLDADQWAALDTGASEITVSYPGGSWVGTVDFSQVEQPTQVPTLTSPVPDQSDTGLAPTVQWQAWEGAPLSGEVQVDLTDVTWDEDLYEALLATDASSWQVPESLQAGHRCEVEVDFTDHATLMVDGVTVHVYAEAESDTQFDIVSSGVGEVWMDRGIDYGVPSEFRDDACIYGLDITGAGITSIEITTPWGQSHELGELLPAGWNGQDYVETQRGALRFRADSYGGLTWYEFDWEWLSDSQWASLDTGQTTVAVMYGVGEVWEAVLDFTGVIQTNREPNPTSPTHRQMEPGNLTVEWAQWENPPEDGLIHINIEDARPEWLGGGSWDEESELPVTATSGVPCCWRPRCTTCSLPTEHRVRVAVSGWVRSTWTATMTTFAPDQRTSFWSRQ